MIMECIDPILYTHRALNQENTAIGGHYVITKEVRLPFETEEILYLVGYGILDTTCCGTGGCAYAMVYGYIDKWKNGKDQDNLITSDIIPIRNDSLKKRISDVIKTCETVTQVNFM